ncbi:MAG: CPBP family intramembrane glutamic endopeptidase [Acidimicrobiales bacterium]
MSALRSRQGNPFGIMEALVGLAGGFLLSTVALSIYDSAEHLGTGADTVPQVVISLFALWTGFVGAAVLASHLQAPARVAIGGDELIESGGTGSVIRDYGLSLRPWPDIPLGIVVGVACQFLLVPLMELPLRPFVHHLGQRLGHPAQQIIGPASSAGTGDIVVIAVLICLGSPIVEELFFRGLVLRALLWRFRSIGSPLAPALSIVATGLFFGLVHFEALQFLGLAGFGVALGVLAYRTGRLGPSIVAHMAFNTSTVIVFVLTH